MYFRKSEGGFNLKKWWTLLIAIVFIISACGNEEQQSSETEKKEVKNEEVVEQPKEQKETEDTEGITANDAYKWLNKSGLVTGTAEDITKKFEGSEGLIKALRTDEADIMEFEKEDYAARYHNPDLNAYAVKNIYILIKKGEDNAENFVKVLESRKPLTDLETTYSSSAQEAFVKKIDSGINFVDYADSFYKLPAKERGSTYSTFIIDNEVKWTGTVADLEAMSDSIVIYGKNDYNGEDWDTISTKKKEMMPYTVVVELQDKTIKEDLKPGDKVTVKGIIGSRGDKKKQYNWKIYNGKIIN